LNLDANSTCESEFDVQTRISLTWSRRFNLNFLILA
jgi:hypothetical protein